MNIALDFDETYTLSPFFWDEFIQLTKAHGHKVVVVTIRHEYWDAHPYLDDLKDNGLQVVFTDGRAKKPFCEELGINIDVWTDDRPDYINNNSKWKHTSKELHDWRVENYENFSKQGYHEYIRDLSKYEMKDEW
jgi:hydroxymethylpyrimidine pyrophosphatase-like HAD family hydrolase